MKIALGSDHAGVDYKKAIAEHLRSKGIETLDFGPFTTDAVDYPDYIHPVARAVESGQADLGITLCGSGNGAAMTANKHAGIRAALCWTPEWPVTGPPPQRCQCAGHPRTFCQPVPGPGDGGRIPGRAFRRGTAPTPHREDPRKGLMRPLRS